MITPQEPPASAFPFEPYRIKMVEAIRPTTREERECVLEEARFNLFKVPSEFVTIDLLTDSGTAAMSDNQWSAMMRGDEAYAGSRSFKRFERAVRALTGYANVMPTHQGRAAEHLLFGLLAKAGDTVPNNCHFDTTRANLENLGVIAVDCVGDCAYEPDRACPFKGNMDLGRLERALDGGRVPFVLITVTNNSGGGQPVSLRNLRAVSALLRSRGIPFFIDACRFAENAWFIREREHPDRSVRDLVFEMFSLADGCLMSAKKDGLVNIGGFFACNDPDLAERFKQKMVLTEGFPDYGGLAGRDLEAIAVGLHEAVEESFLAHRVGQVRHLAERLHGQGIPIVRPPGGHAVFIDAKKFLPHIPASEFPGQALACALYLEGGIRSCEIGSLMFSRKGESPRLELVRLAIPSRVYTTSHLDFVAECAARVFNRRNDLDGLRLTNDPPYLRHFTAELAAVR
ncbi:MAG TPA: tryptophanase [Planctomycetota bacterium]|jgi:tryptophanase